MAPRPCAPAVLIAGIVVLAAAAPVRAVPPSAPFPAAIAPAGAVMPANGRALVFGGETVSLSAIGAGARLAGAALPVSLERIGCCTVAVTFEQPLLAGAELSLLVSGPTGELERTWTIGDDDDTAPSLGDAEIVQVVSASRLVPPMTPQEGPAFILTLDVAEVADDVEVSALASFDDDGQLITLEPPSGQQYERMLTGVAGAVVEACVGVEVWDGAGNTSPRERVCAPLPSADGDAGGDDAGDGGCAAVASSSSSLLLFVLSLLAAARLRAERSRRDRARRRRQAACHAMGLLLLPSVLACAPEAAPDERETRGCGDGFDDHTYEPAAFDDAFFDEHARPQYGWRALKLLVVYLEDPQRRRVRLYDDDFYALHDEWFYFRLMNGVGACGAEQIEPVPDAGPFESVGDIIAWAREQLLLPPFLAWHEDRLTAPDFYRLSRDSDPRVYAPAYLTRDVDGEPNAYAVRVAGPDAITARELAALFDALDPWMPNGTPLYWTPSPQRESHQALADALVAANDPLAERIRRR